MSGHKILLSGLPNTGKTTFIAALWYLVRSDSPNRSLALNSLERGEHEYLNKISFEWLSFEKVPRTNPGVIEPVIMNLKNIQTGELISLDIPDFSGEIFREHFDNREWTIELYELFNEVAGVLLFINPDDPKNRPSLVSDAIEAANILGEAPPVVNDLTKLISWNSSHTSNQVKMVEHLQMISYYKPEILPMKIGIIISAWDKVEDMANPQILPEQWLKLNLPLLYQYLITNKQDFVLEIFGVSAQGIDYKNKEGVDKLAESSAEERICVKRGNVISKDIAEPITWVSI